MKKNLARCVLAGLLIIFCPGHGFTLPPESGQREAASLLTLPDPQDRAQKLILNKHNIAGYRELLLAPIASWIEEGVFAARLFRSEDFSWDEAFSGVEEKGKNRVGFSFDQNFSLVSGAEWTNAGGGALPFGRAEEVDLEEDLEHKAYQILWNAQAMESGARSLFYEIKLSWIGVQSILRQSEGIFYRKHFAVQAPELAAVTPAPSPSPVPEQPLAPVSPGELFRQEVLQLISPPVVFSYAHLTWRYRGMHDDEGWVYSPVIGASRRVLSANRSDALLGGVLTMDDLFVWSTKIQRVSARVVGEKELLVPVPGLSTYAAEPEPVSLEGLLIPPEIDAKKSAAEEKNPDNQKAVAVPGFYQESNGSRAAVLFNGESRQYPELAAWVPSTVAFVPHRVWIIELTPKEPLYSAGREILVVDKESLLPVYKLAYDNLGVMQRVVIGSWGLASSKNENTKFPFCAFVLAVQAVGRDAMALVTRQVFLIQPQNSSFMKRADALLNIAAHGKKEATKSVKAEDEPGAKSTPHPQPEGAVGEEVSPED